MNDTSPRPLQVGYLVVGLVFLGIASAWALRAGGVVDTSQMQWLIPLVLVAAGVVGLVAFGARNVRRGHDRTLDETDEQTYDQTYDHQTYDAPGNQPDDTEPTLPIEGDHR